MGSNYLSKFGYVVRKEALQEEELAAIRRDLVGRPLGEICDSVYPIYVETKTKMYLPKMYGLKHFGPAREMSNYVGEDVTVEFKGQLLPHQVEATHVMREELLKKSGGGILSLGTGLGKTFCALHLIHAVKKKTIVVVNKITLMKQWESEIKTYLPGARIGFLQGQKNVDLHEKDIVIAMLQSLGRIEYPVSLFDDIGFTIIDETHNIASKVFSKVLMKLNSKYTLGLSATPQRGDGCEYVFKWFLGDVMYSLKQTQRGGLPPIIHTIKMNSQNYKEVTVKNKYTGKEQIQYAQMLNELVALDSRNKFIVEKIKHLVLSQKRRVLVLSDRREHLKILKGLMDKDDSCRSFTYGLFIGQMKMKDLTVSKSSDVILATFSAFGEGVSEKDLDTLIMVTPKKFIGHMTDTAKQENGKLEQIVGRIFRKVHTRIAPMILDLQDNFSIFRNQTKQRMAFYKGHFGNVQYRYQTIDLDNNTEEETGEEEFDVGQVVCYNKCLLD
jgi:superfamily II DNA or RNA helicase